MIFNAFCGFCGHHCVEYFPEKLLLLSFSLLGHKNTWNIYSFDFMEHQKYFFNDIILILSCQKILLAKIYNCLSKKKKKKSNSIEINFSDVCSAMHLLSINFRLLAPVGDLGMSARRSLSLLAVTEIHLHRGNHLLGGLATAIGCSWFFLPFHVPYIESFSMRLSFMTRWRVVVASSCRNRHDYTCFEHTQISLVICCKMTR